MKNDDNGLLWFIRKDLLAFYREELRALVLPWPRNLATGNGCDCILSVEVIKFTFHIHCS